MLIGWKRVKCTFGECFHSYARVEKTRPCQLNQPPDGSKISSSEKAMCRFRLQMNANAREMPWHFPELKCAPLLNSRGDFFDLTQQFRTRTSFYTMSLNRPYSLKQNHAHPCCWLLMIFRLHVSRAKMEWRIQLQEAFRVILWGNLGW